jgi:hypothetical protein
MLDYKLKDRILWLKLEGFFKDIFPITKSFFKNLKYNLSLESMLVDLDEINLGFLYSI